MWFAFVHMHVPTSQFIVIGVILVTTPTIKTDLGCYLALDDMPLELAQMRSGAMYWVGIPAESDSLFLAGQIINKAEPEARVALISTVDPRPLMENLPRTAGPAFVHGYRLTGHSSKALKALIKDLDRAMRPKQRTLLLCLPAACFPAETDGLLELLTRWRDWLQRNACVLLILAFGEPAVTVTDRLLAHNHILSGLARLEANQERTAYIYTVLHWRNALGAVGLTEIEVIRREQQFEVAKRQFKRSYAGGDRNQYFLERSVLGGMSVAMLEGWHVCESAEEIVAIGLCANAATIVFGLETDADLPRLARVLHELRRKRGPALKLVVREMQRTLRYQDEQLLLACGATLVVSAGTDLYHFYSLLERVQEMTYTRELVDDLDAFLASRRNVKIRGKVISDQFLAYLKQILDGPESSAINGVLLAMSPVPGISPALAMRQLRLRRFGDVACELGGVVYLFLYGCQPQLIEAALGNVFVLPYREIFSHHAAYVSIDQMRMEYLAMRALYRSQNGAECSDVLLESSDSDSPDRSTAAHEETAESFHPRLLALPIINTNYE